MHKLTFTKWLTLITVVIATTGSMAADFCVTDSMEFQAALISAASNGQDDLIKLETGYYPIIHESPFYYIASIGEDHDLKITGGFIRFLNIPCGSIALNNSALETELDGLSLNGVLEITPLGTANIDISALYFVNGDTTIANPFGRGAGLQVFGFTGYTGDILIENNAFVANSAKFGSALSINSGNKTTVRNNLVTANTAELGTAIELISNDQLGIYFTNNTVISNSTGGTGFLISAAYIAVSGTSQAYIANNILWNNEHKDLSFLSNTYLYNNDIGVYQGTPVDESGNFSVEPEFEPAAPGGLSFTPAYNSNLYNQGIQPPLIPPINPSFELNWGMGDNDTFGRDRVVNGRIDIGSYETPRETPIFIDGFES